MNTCMKWPVTVVWRLAWRWRAVGQVIQRRPSWVPRHGCDARPVLRTKATNVCVSWASRSRSWPRLASALLDADPAE